MAFMLPQTTAMPPNFQAGGGMPYMANPNVQMQPQQAIPQQLMPQQPMQQPVSQYGQQPGTLNLSGHPPNFASLQPAGGGYMGTTNTGSPKLGPQINGLPNVGKIGLAGPSPQFGRFTGMR